MSKLFNSIHANKLNNSIDILRRVTEMNKILYKNYNSYEVGNALKQQGMVYGLQSNFKNAILKISDTLQIFEKIHIGT